jgi:hypothetical protein
MMTLVTLFGALGLVCVSLEASGVAAVFFGLAMLLLRFG